MDVTRLLVQSGTILLRTVAADVDEFGDPTYIDTPKSFACWLHQTARSEVTLSEDTQAETWELYLEPAAAGVVDGSAAITVAAVAFEFLGPPWPAVNPRTGDTEFVEATVKRVV